MVRLFSAERRVRTWRRLWIALAEAQRELGLPIAEEQVAELRAHEADIDFEFAERKERELRHDVMAHIDAYGAVCPKAKPILHLGATSAYVTDNADLILLREALRLVRDRLVQGIEPLAAFARRWKDLPVLGFTHFQPAQCTTLGKRASLWVQDLAMDLAEVERAASDLRLLGVKGTTGTQASFLRLFGGDEAKVRELDARVCAKLEFASAYLVTGQTYPRKVDFRVLAAVSGIAPSASKFATDIRLLMHRGEVDEPLEPSQVGSSAMPYKRNPVRSERICSLARYLLSLLPNAAETAGSQWLERTLDDSANRRIVLPEAFLAADAILLLVADVAAGLDVHPERIRAGLALELPFLATEDLLMDAVAAGGDRQALHERIRLHAREVAGRLRDGEARNDLLERLRGDPAFARVRDRIDGATDPSRLVGRAPAQVEEFLRDEVDPMLRRLRPSVPRAEVRV
jgi:adenylosuccinate lyase